MHFSIKCAIKTVSCVAVTFLVLVLATCRSTEASNSEKSESKSQEPAPDFTCDGSYMVVSTINGKISVLNLREHGRLAWSVDADARPLVSSSLANLEVVRNGKKLRLIPALDGAIYQYDGEKVEPIPMSAESLLSSTYQLSDDAMIVGSKSLQNIGINYKTGEIQFICDSDGCRSNEGQTKDPVNGSDVVVITRITKIVRSVDIKHGQEKWNFSVGEHLLSLPNSSTQSQIEDHGEELPRMFTYKKEKCPFADDAGHEHFLRLIVPDGRVVALNKHSSSVAWEHKFDSPIAKAWLLEKGKLHLMNLFTEQHIPTLSTFTTDNVETDSTTQPLLYIGSHHKLLYIQPSPGMEAVLKMYSGRRIGHVFDPSIQVAWKPYLNTASVRTPIFGGNRRMMDDKKNKKNEKQIKSLTVWHEEYPFDTGYFLYPEFKDSRSIKPVPIKNLLENRLKDSMANFFWSFRIEIIVIVAFTVFTSLAVDYLMGKFSFSRRILNLSSDSGSVGGQTEEVQQSPLNCSESLLPLPEKGSTSDEYVSRFEADFDCVQCLGKGGFGVVMEAVNKVDDQHYAVKRIQLPRSEGAKEKMLREVKALAKLEHIGIVRYFNAWVESPPTGWQEEKDLSLELSDASRQTVTNITASPVSHSHVRPFKNSNKKSNLVYAGRDNDDASNSCLRGEADLDTDMTSDSVVFASEYSEKHLPGSGSGEFSVHSNINEPQSSSSDTGFSFLRGCPNESKSSFTLEDEESHSHSRSSIPFSNYSMSSSSVEPAVDDDDLSADSVVFDESKSFDKKSSENLIALNCASVQISPSCHGHSVEDTEPISEKKTNERKAKFFLYIQMQLYQKETLKEWLHNNTLNRERSELIAIFDQILCAVDYVHSCGLMHRDLKPSNIFFSAEGVVKVGDFGLVTRLSVQEDEDCNCCDGFSSDGHTHTADVGTTLYMSPEQIARKPYNLKVDVFSLGLIFLELWMPFSTQMERVRTLQDAKKRILPSRFERELPVECELVRRMTSEDPSLRPNIKEIMEHSLLKDLAPTRFTQRHRTRTISNDSND